MFAAIVDAKQTGASYLEDSAAARNQRATKALTETDEFQAIDEVFDRIELESEAVLQL